MNPSLQHAPPGGETEMEGEALEFTADLVRGNSEPSWGNCAVKLPGKALARLALEHKVEAHDIAASAILILVSRYACADSGFIDFQDTGQAVRLNIRIDPEKGLMDNARSFRHMAQCAAVGSDARSAGACSILIRAVKHPSRREQTHSGEILFELIMLGGTPVELQVVWRSDVFRREGIALWLEHFQILLHSALQDSSMASRQLPIMSEEEKRQTLEDFNRWSAPPLAPGTIFTHVRPWAWPADGVAAIFRSHVLTWGELDDLSDRLAHYLRHTLRAKRVGMLVSRNEWTLVCVLGILKSGAIYVPIDPAYPRDRIHLMARDAEIDAALIDGDNEELLPPGLAIVDLERDRAAIIGSDRIKDLAHLKPQDVAYLIYTSGSTGQPKGVQICHQNAHAFLQWASLEYASQPFEILYAATSYCFDISIFEFLLPACCGKPVRILGNALEIPFWLRKDRNVLVNTVPSVVRTLLSEQIDLSNVCVLNMAGEAIPPWFREELPFDRVACYNLYGPTEDTTYSTYYRFARDGHPIIPVGRPIAYTRLYVLDRWMNAQPIGAPGEIWLSGAGVSVGYLGRPELTADRYLRDPFVPGQRMYRTGDIGRWLPDGNVEFLGRRDHQVKVRGFRIELEEVARAMEQHPRVESGVVVVHENAAMQSLAGFYTSESSLEEAELRRFLDERLPAHMVPAHLRRLADMPLTDNGKIDRRRLPKSSQPQSPAVKQPLFADQEERVIAQIWSVLLGYPPTERENSFFTSGGNSLTAAQLAIRLANRFSVPLDTELIFSHPTIGQQAAWVRAQGRSARKPLLQASPQIDFSLTPAQERIWVMCELDETSRAYNMFGGLELRGPVDLSLLQDAWLQLVFRHESLRTVFVKHGSRQIRQRFVPLDPSAHGLAVTDLCDRPHPRQEATDRMNNDIRTPFDLFSGPLMRAAAYQLSENHYLTWLTMHHLIGDGWSLQVIFTEWGRIYERLRGDKGFKAPPLRFQFRDVAQWLSSEREDKSFRKGEKFWRGYLGENPASLELPLDYPRPPVFRHRGAHVRRLISHQAVRNLDEFCASQGATRFTGLLALLFAFLSRYTGQNEILLGSVISDRGRPELENQIGLFIHTVPLRGVIESDTTLASLLATVSSQWTQLMTHRKLPFDRIVRMLGTNRDMRRSALVDLLVVYQNQSAIEVPLEELPEKAWDGLCFQPWIEPAGDTCKADMVWEFRDDAAGLWLDFEFNTDLFAEQSIHRLSELFVSFFLTALITPQVKVRSLDYLSPADKQRLAFDYNRTAVPYPSGDSIPGLFFREALRAPDSMAIVDARESWTYGQLAEVSQRMAARLLRENGGRAFEPDSCISVVLEKTPWALAAFLAVMRVGATCVPIDPTYPHLRIEQIRADCGSALEINADWLASFLESAVNHSVEMRLPAIDPETAAFVFYTSGSTGKPKGVVVTHRNVVRLVKPGDYASLDQNAIILSTGSISFDAVTFEFWGALLNGGKVVLCSKDILLSPSALTALIEEQKITHAWFTASLFHQLSEAKPGIFQRLRYLLAGGERLSATHINRVLEACPGLAIINGYGPTENTTFSLCHTIRTPVAEPVPIGVPIANSLAYVFDQNMQLAPENVAGELYVGGDGVARGYLGQPELTKERFVDNPFVMGGRLYRTGDRCRRGTDGFIRFLGRFDHQAKIRGFRVEPEEVEAALRSLPGITAAAVKAIPARASTYQLVAWYSGGTLEPQSILTQMSQVLPDYMVPAHCHRLAALPLTASGKVDYQKLVDPSTVARSRTDSRPSAPSERFVLKAFESALECKGIGLDDHFFDSGGNSIALVKLLAQLEDAYPGHLTIADVVRNPTARSLAAHVETFEGRHHALAALPAFAPPPRGKRDPTRVFATVSQQRLWRLHREDPANSQFNIAVSFDVPCRPELDVAREALERLVIRHEALRSEFEGGGEEVRMKITSITNLPLKWHDLAGRGLEEQEKAVAAILETDAQKPIDVSRAPLFRVHGFALSATQLRMVLLIDHIICDGWSVELLKDDFGVIYQQLLAGRRPRLPKLKHQFSDYARWQEKFLNTPNLVEPVAAYWKNQLSGGMKMVALPGANAGAVGKSEIASSIYRFAIRPELNEKLKAFAAKEKSTPHFTLLAAYHLLLARLSGQDQIVTAIPAANRIHESLYRVVGFFVDSVLVCNAVDSRESIRAFVARITDNSYLAVRHSIFPIENVCAQVGLTWQQILSNFFNYANFLTGPSTLLTDLEPAFIERTQHAKFDLVAYLVQFSNAIEVKLHYRIARFSSDDIETIAQTYIHIVQAMVERPGDSVARLLRGHGR